MSDDLGNLAHHVKTRRLALGLTQMAVWKEKAGPSSTTIGDIEAALPPPPSPSTKRKLERALRWDEGSVDLVLAGGSPLEIAEETLTPEAVTTSSETALIHKLDEAQASFEAAVGALVQAEGEMDSAVRQWAAMAALQQKLFDEKLSRERELGRRLTTQEYLDLHVPRPTAGEIAEMTAFSAMHDPRDWTRYEMALIERVFDDYPQDVRKGSRFADLEPLRERVQRLNIVPVSEEQDDEVTPPVLRAARNPGRPGSNVDKEPLSEPDD